MNLSGREKVLQNRNKITQMIRKTTPDNLQELKYRLRHKRWPEMFEADQVDKQYICLFLRHIILL